MTKLRHFVRQIDKLCGSCFNEWHLVECRDGHGVFCPLHNPDNCPGVPDYFRRLRV